MRPQERDEILRRHFKVDSLAEIPSHALRQYMRQVRAEGQRELAELIELELIERTARMAAEAVCTH